MAAGADTAICEGSTYTLAGSRGGSATSSTWTTSGTGTFSNASLVNAVYTPSASDITAGTVTLTITTNDPAGPCPAATDEMVLDINPAATVSAGADASICSGGVYTLSGSRGGSATSSTWTSSGTGTFDNATIVNATYTPSAADIAAGVVTLTITTDDPAGACPAATDNMVLTINPGASAFAGSDTSICAGNSVTLGGSFGGNATTSTWTTTGTGTFNNASIVNAVYAPSAADLSAGTVILILTTDDPAGPCPAAVDSLVLNINPVAIVSAGADATICSGSNYSLNGSLAGSATSSIWSTSGTGTFNDASLSNAVYTPSAADITSGFVTLTITTNDPAGPCSAVSDNMILTINPAATVSAGADVTICNGNVYTLGGIRGGGATSSIWTTSGTGSFNNANLLNATYVPSAADVAAGSVTLTITTNDPAGPCPAVSDAMVITINPSATVNAGADATICSGSTYTLNGTRGGSATSSTWVSNGSGTFDNPFLLNATYTPSAADIAAGALTLTLTTDNPPGPCPAVFDAMILTISPAATVNAGADTSICAGNVYQLGGTRGGSASSSTWTTSGTGTFSNATILNPVYTPSAADITAGTVTFTLTSNDPAGPCPAASDVMTLSIDQPATVSAGADVTICSGNSYSLLGNSGGSATSINWTTSGTGLFDDASLLNATYTPSAADITAGTVNLTITTNDPAGACSAATDVMVVTINPAATISAGADTSICEGTVLTLSGTRGGSATSSAWTTSGTGTFSNTTITNPDYTPSAADILAGTVTLTITSNDPAGPCQAVSDSMVVTINPLAIVSAGADASICSVDTYTLNGVLSGSAVTSTWTTSGTGAFDDATLPAATYTPSTADITAGSVTLTITSNDPAGACYAAVDSMVLTINSSSAAFTYPSSAYCQAAANPSALITGTPGGVFTSTAGLVFSDSTTGLIDLPASTTGGPYTITYTSPGACPSTATYDVTINGEDDPSFSFSSATFCQSSSNPVPVITGTPGGLFTGQTEVIFANTSTGEIDIAASTAGGPYNVTYTTNGVCPHASTIAITIATGFDATFDFTGDFYCQNDVNPVPVIIAPASAGSFSSLPAGLNFVSTNTGEVNLASSTPGTYVITNEIPAAGSCPAALFTDTITINELATVSAGTNAVICSNNSYTLSGSMGGSTTDVTWSTTGTGSFDDATLLNATYTPSAADITSGAVTLTITSNDPDGTGPCVPAAAGMTLTINPAAVVNAGPDLTTCAGSYVLINAATGGSTTSVTWSTLGTGTFNSTSIVTPIYTPSAADISAGAVQLVMSSNDPAGPCGIATDTMNLTIHPVATADAGSTATICANSSYTLNGTIGGSATTSVWSTSGTGVFDDSTLTNATYTPSPADEIAGMVTLTLTTDDPDGSGPCGPAISSMTLMLNPSATAEAGSDTSICSVNTLTLSGAIGGDATSSNWTTSGTGMFDNSSLLNPVYTPSSGDITAGTVTLIITTDDPAGLCPAAADSLVLTINPASFVSAGSDTAICSGTSLTLSGSMSGSATGIVWSTSGTGTFDDATLTNAVYTPSAADSIAGNVILTITSNDPDTTGPCTPATDAMILIINPADNSSFTYASTDICNGGANPVPVISGITGGQFTESSGNVVFASTATGEIDLASSTVGGPYTISYTTNGTCFTTSTFDITIHPEGDPSFSYVSGTICQNDTNPVPVITGTPGGLFTEATGLLAIDSLTGSIDLGASAAGTYSITYTTGGICSNSSAVNLTISTTIDASFTLDSTYCQGDANPVPVFPPNASAGVFSASPSGLQFANTTTGEIDLANSTPGTYTITNFIAASGSCDSSLVTATITINPRAMVDAGADVFICSGSDAQLSGTPGGSASAFTWSTAGSGTFDNNQSLTPLYTPSANDISAGSVMLYLQTNDPDGNGPCSFAVDSVTVFISNQNVANAGPDQIVCDYVAAVNLVGTVSGGSGTGIWTTSGSGTFTPSNTDLNATYIFSSADTAAGSVTLILTSLNNGSCQAAVDTMNISITTVPVIDAGADTTVYSSNVNIPINGTVTGGTGTGQWTTTGSGTFVPADTSLSAIYQISNGDILAGTVSLVLTSSQSCIVNPDTVVITIITNPILVDAGADQAICEGGAISLSGTIVNANGGQWTTSGNGTFLPDDTTMNVTYIPGSADIASGNAVILLTSNSNGPFPGVADSMMLTIHALPQSAFTHGSTCGQLLQFTDSTVVVNDTISSWQWDFGDGTTDTAQNPQHLFPNYGAYNVSLITTTQFGCSDTVTMPVYLNPIPVAAFTSLANCISDSVVFTSSASIASGTINGWNWDFGDSTSSANENTAHLYQSAGIYPVTFTVTSDSGCSAAVTDSVQLFEMPVAAYTFVSSCNDTIQFTDASAVTGSSITGWSWDFGDGTSSTLQNPVHIFGSAGSYVVTLSVTTSAGCSALFTDTVYPSATPTALFTHTGSCSSTLNFTDLSSGNGGVITSWMWDFGDGGTDTLQNPAHDYSAAGTYPVTLIVTTQAGCQQSITGNVTVTLPPAALYTSVQNCVSDSVYFTDGSTASGSTLIQWSWDFGDGTSAGIENPVHQFAAAGIYNVTLIVTDINGCSATYSQAVNVTALPVAAYTPNGGSYTANTLVNYTNQSLNSLSWFWDFGDGSSTSDADPSHAFQQAGNYQVVLIATSANGCTDTIAYPFVITDEPVSEPGGVVAVPSAFTPDNDGNNDILYVKGGPFVKFDFRVFNEWGNEIFRSNSQSDGWDGTYKGAKQPNGKYVWILTGTTISNTDVRISGDVTILK
ncbi:MAG TPA: PKD domain-containing protein [Bacteroidia bacterium]|nr:PKD domain-containing protein [Bacteroidia bacterium]